MNANPSAEKALVIVESPAKARTIARFLPPEFVVEASIGHVRDLPNSAKEIPAKLKKESWARLGIDVDNDFEPLYIVPPEKRKQVNHLKKLLKDADVLYLATDEDREGESISWHLSEVLAPKVPQKRLVFHEITKEAIEEALSSPRELDTRLVRAQEARRLLDRLYGYEISPILWRKIRPRLSAGRVQSVAVRLTVDRERLRRRFVRSTYWDLVAELQAAEGGAFEAQLVQLGERRIASGKDFDNATGELSADREKTALLLEEDAQQLVERLKATDFTVTEVERKPYTSKPAPPFTTSTLQQEANRKLRFSARRTMQTAQRLYENGHITYMRTDSTSLAESAVRNIRGFVEKRYGKEYLSQEDRVFKTKVKNAQEAHEAIRPSLDFVRPRDLASQLGPDEAKLYELIWKRTMACQMARARGHRIQVRVQADDATFQASGKTIEFAGFMRAYAEGSDDPSAELADQEILLPPVESGEQLECRDLDGREHTTQPPARYTEASLVKELEAKGIGRPSTYASIIDTILRREYVVRKSNALVPTFTAFAVVKLLENYFSDLVDFDFTARLEDDLDAISLGSKEPLPYLEQFYFGSEHKNGLKKLTEQEIDPRESCTLLVGLDEDDQKINVRVGKYGPYLERGEERATIPDATPPDELSVETALEILRRGSQANQLGEHPETGEPVYLKSGRFGPYVQLGDGDDDTKPKMKSLLPGMDPEDVDLGIALELLSLPRSIGACPDTGEDIEVDFGRYGPYLRRGKETRSLDAAEKVFSVTVEEAAALFRQEKKGRGRGPKVIKELGEDADSGKSIRLLDGRYGPYVSDGKTNASLPRGSDPEEVDLATAVEMIRAKAAAPPRRRAGRRSKKS